MRIITIIVGTLIILPLITLSSRATVPEYSFSFSTSGKTRFLIAGEIGIYGRLTGKNFPAGMLPIDSYYISNLSYPDLNSTLNWLVNSQNIRALSIISTKLNILSIDTVYVINLSSRHVNRFDDGKLYVENTPIIIFGDMEYMRFKREINYGIFSFDKMEISGQNISSMLLVTDDNVSINIENSPSFIISPYTKYGQINGYSAIFDRNGSKIWQDSTGNWMIVVKTSPLSIDISSSFSLLLFDQMNNVSIGVKRTSKMPYASNLLYNISSSLSSFGVESLDIPDIALRYASPFLNVLNGACLLFNSNDTVYINTEKYAFSKFGLVRFTSADFSISNTGGVFSLRGSGESPFIFLGNMVYDDIPVTKVGNVPLPTHSISLWLLAIGLFIIFSIIFRRKGEEKVFGIFPLRISDRDRRLIKRSFLLLHLTFSILTLFLFDYAFDTIFGLSFISALDQNILISIIIVSIEITFIATCYIMFGLPSRIGTNSLINFVGLGKEGKNIGKTVGIIVMWIFSLYYITFLSNAVVGLVRDIMMGMAP